MDDTYSADAMHVSVRIARPPSVDRLLGRPAAAPLIERYGRDVTLATMRTRLDAWRRTTSHADKPSAFDEPAFLDICAAELAALHTPSLRPVFNLTGTVIHTNLGRALLPEEACEAVLAVMRNPSTLEFDLERGERGERDDHVEGLICRLTGAEAATIVNNNAAAVLILLNTFALGREVLVSRGELVEIGGSFRIPDVMQRAGARLREVGTTNRTHLRDFADAVGPDTAMALKVHTSNYRIEGFTAAAAAEDLAGLCRERGIIFAEDLGSGTLVDLGRWSLPREPTVQDSLADAALVTFSGDKLLGGVQCGFIAGRRDLVARIRRNPLKRALRVDKMTLAATEAVLRLYLDPDRLAQRLPTLRMLSRTPADIGAAAERLRLALSERLGGLVEVSIAPCRSQIGSGALPQSTLDSVGLRMRPRQGRGAGGVLQRLAAAFRGLPVPVIGRLEDGALCFDLRCLEDEAGFVTQLAALDWRGVDLAKSGRGAGDDAR